MGFQRALIKLTAEVIGQGKLGGKVLIIGKQDICGTETQVRRWLHEAGLPPALDCRVALNQKPDYGGRGFIDDTSLFKLMGFQQADSLDYSDFEGANLIWDLNQPVPENWNNLGGQYDLVIDSGCTEHIFNVAQVFKNYHFFAKPGGVVIHILPTSNFVDHGFYMFGPTLFHDYYSANRWKVLCSYLIRHRAYSEFGRRDVFVYTRSGALQSVSVGGFDTRSYLTFVAVQKQNDSTCDAPVQQGFYEKTWVGNNSNNPGSNQFKERLTAWVKTLPPPIICLLLQVRAAWFRMRGVSCALKLYKSL